jgi:hypothetical protein
MNKPSFIPHSYEEHLQMLHDKRPDLMTPIQKDTKLTQDACRARNGVICDNIRDSVSTACPECAVRTYRDAAIVPVIS